jgi:hypothetical protein
MTKLRTADFAPGGMKLPNAITQIKRCRRMNYRPSLGVVAHLGWNGDMPNHIILHISCTEIF